MTAYISLYWELYLRAVYQCCLLWLCWTPFITYKGSYKDSSDFLWMMLSPVKKANFMSPFPLAVVYFFFLHVCPSKDLYYKLTRNVDTGCFCLILDLRRKAFTTVGCRIFIVLLIRFRNFSFIPSLLRVFIKNRWLFWNAFSPYFVIVSLSFSLLMW